MANLQSHSGSTIREKERLRKAMSTFSRVDAQGQSQSHILMEPAEGGRGQRAEVLGLDMVLGSLGDGDEVEGQGPIPVQAGESRSIEIFFGKFTTFQTFHQALCDHGVSVPGEVQDVCTTKVKPDSIRKLVMVSHPMTSFAGMSRFAKLSEAWVTNCKIGEGKWSDFDGMKSLHKLYIYNCSLDKLEALHFQNLKVLWVAGNNLQSLNFLGTGMPSLNELNAAQNEITCLLEEQLFKCMSLQTLNLSGNPLCTVQDVQAVKVLANLQSLHLADPLYGKCPVAGLCDGRTMLLSILTNISNLDGKVVTPSELVTIQEYVNSRSLYYYANSVQAVAKQVALRKTGIGAAHKNMESIGHRLVQLLTLSSLFRRALDSVDLIPQFANARNNLKDHLVKMETRSAKLRELAAISIRRLETVIQISRWEQETERWMKWIEFQSYGNTQCHIIQSVHGPRIDDSVQLCGSIHQLVSALACPNLWPQNTITKVETVIVVRDKGMDAGMERTYDESFAKKDEPIYVPPPPDTPIPTPNHPVDAQGSYLSQTLSGPTYPFYGLPVPPPKIIQTYTKPDYKTPTPAHNFPDSVPGLPDRMEPLFMFLVCPPSTSPNPLTFLHRIITERSRYYKDIRVTNCLWIAAGQNRGASNFAVVVVVKVLPECLQAIQQDKRVCAQHSWDCTSFCMKRPLTVAPAYILNISFTTEDKQAPWPRATSTDEDVITPARAALSSLTGKINSYKFPSGTKRKSKKSPFVRKVCDGIHADLSAVQLYVNKDGSVEPTDPLSADYVPGQTNFDIQNVPKFLGLEATQFLTTLDLAGNRLGLTIGLEGLNTLKKLNLSHNNLTTLSGLHKLPNLIEFKVGWNYLRFLHSNACTLAWAAPRLMTLEILPNPFQDVRDFGHIPILLRRALIMLHRVDVWTSPFSSPSPLHNFNPPMVADAGFTHVAMAKSWVGTAHAYSDLASRCLTELELMPSTPPFPEGFGSNGMDLNLSDNYLNSHSLCYSPFVQSAEWRTSLVKLQLQENMIANLDWMKDRPFPNVQILNLSNNHLTEVDLIPQSFHALRYLQLCGNPLAADIVVLSPIRLLPNLNTLDCSGSPLASHPDYGGYVYKFLSNVQILDGIPISSWELGESVERLGGTMSQDWLEDKLGHRNFSTLTQLSFPNSNLQKVTLPSQSLTKLFSLDLQDNYLSSLTSLAALPNLRVLCVSHNSIANLGSHPCPTCYTHTAESQAANAQKLRRPTSKQGGASEYAGMGPLVFQPRPSNVADFLNATMQDWAGHSLLGRSSTSPNTANTSMKLVGSKYSPPVPARKHKFLFPRLEVLIMAHNGLTALSDLHLHAMPTLQTVILNCNQLTSLQGLHDLPTVKALILDNNKIKDVPRNSLIGCSSLRFLHLEHNRISALPRLPHLTNLTSLYLSYNKIQCLTDLGCVAGSGSGVTELTLTGNPISFRTDYRLNLKARIPQLDSLDGQDLSMERSLLDELTGRWFPGTASAIREYASHDPVFRPKEGMEKGAQVQQASEFGLKVKSLSPHLATASPRSFQFAAFKPPKRSDYI